MNIVILTKEMLLNGMQGGIGISTYQASLIGIELSKGWKHKVIGKVIDKENYNRFLKSKGVSSKKAIQLFGQPNKNPKTGKILEKKQNFTGKEVTYQVEEDGTLTVISVR